MRSLFIAVLLLCCFVSVSHAAKIDTSFRYSTIETDHFSIHYHQGLQDLARKTALFAEEIHGKLVQEFQWRPLEKTQIVMIDDSDFTNGMAITIPYNTIYLQTVPPTLASGIGEYDDWLRMLITHEYAHILSADPASGYSKITRTIFGKPLPNLDPLSGLFFLFTAPPNTFMPRWWHEGMATWAESKYTGQGRGKGSYYDMVFRTAVAEQNIPTVDQINGDVPYWPTGHLPYMYGYRLQRYIAETYGGDAAGNLSMAHSGRFPYMISGPPKSLLNGNSYRDLYLDMVDSMTKEQTQRIKLLSQQPFTPLTPVYNDGENLTFPRFSPDGSRIAITRRDPHEHTSVVITDARGERVLAKFRRRISDGSLSWSPDGSRIYFSQAEIVRGFNVYQDLYAYDLHRDEVIRLTHGERLGEVQLSPDGKLFAAVVSFRGNQNLALIDAASPEGKLAQQPVTEYAQERVGAPRWSPDGRSICYVLTDNAGTSSLRLYDVAAKTDRPLLSAGSTLAYPAWSPDGSILYYISDETGVFNVFAYDLSEKKSYQVSHLLTGALQPEVSPDGKRMLVSSYSSRGYKIAQLELERSRWSLTRGPSLPLTRSLPAAAPAQQTKSAEAAAGDAGASSYSSFKTLYPRFWLPRLYDDGSDSVAVGAYTAGADVLGYNTYSLGASYSDGRKRGYYTLVYQNDYFYPTFTLRAHSEPYLYADLYQGGYDYWELNKSVSLEASVPINFLESGYRFRAGYELLDQKALSRLSLNGTFNGIPVFQGRRDNVFAGVSFDNVLRYPYSISSEEGRSISFLYRYFARDIGSDQNLSEYSADYHEYLRLPTRTHRHHVLYLRLSGAVADGDLQYGQQAFQVGGPPSELNPYPLRGYPTRSMTGKYVATGTAEYRAPLTFPMRGFGTAPIFTEKLHTALFADAGQVWDDNRAFHGNDTKVGAGVELRADMTIGYWAKVTPALGFAHGFNRGGENQIYFTLYLGL